MHTSHTTFEPNQLISQVLKADLRVSLSKIEIFGPRYFLDLPSQYVSERVVFWPLCCHEGPRIIGDVFGPSDIFGPSARFFAPERQKNWHAGLGVARNTTTPVSECKDVWSVGDRHDRPIVA